VNKNIRKKLAKRKRKIEKRTQKRNWDNQSKPMMAGRNICYDVDGRHQAIAYGGIGAIHQLAAKTGLINEIDACVTLLKRHLPYHESDHILNIAYNYLAGGSCLQDIELLRNDEGWLNALGAQIIPDPTTAGDFLRRFTKPDICAFMDAKNTVRKKVWQMQPATFLREAVINVDGTICATDGECKQGMDISYNGQWGYHPLVISLHNTREPLFIVNRSGNVASHHDCAPWIDKSLDLVGSCFQKVQLRGDTDFGLTRHFDKWDRQCTFIFGMDAMPNLKKIADQLSASDWQPLEKRPHRQVKTYERRKPENVKQLVVKKRKFKKIITTAEDIAECEYRPVKCKKTYRLIILRKTLDVVRGEMNLFDDVRYFFYITNDRKRSANQMVHFYRGRSDHENDIDQLKNGINALNPASDTLLSNWALMAIASLAWDLKAWFGLLLSYRPLGLSVVRMEFKRFINTFMRIPCLIVRTGRRICYRIVGYNDKLAHVIKFSDRMKSFGFT
jgi:hypothetical protein